ncbi:MAG: diguanylate cyclase [Cycloclasticus sp. symbiont of Bathymodiolus heckerae]|nr:MAG: diguanylate cyclase [Cycloclasticus sp. symbiont of Bathymodiolus heckerae]
MQHQDEPKQAAEYLRQVIPMLSQQKLAPTPINYSVFYSYLSGNSQALNEVVDSHISEKKTFTLALMLELYEKYINGAASLEQQEKIQHALEKAMADASEEIQHVNSGADNYGCSLTQHAQTLSSTDDPQAAAMILKQVMQDTRDMVKNNQEIQARMQETNTEIIKMKAELEAVKASAEKDSLTGLKNRGAFDKAIDSVVYNSNKVSSVLIMLDIDHFKRVNDNFGHLVGDRVIRYVSALLTQIIGKDHHIARYGGEEFAIIINNQKIDAAQQFAEKVRIAMSNSKLQRKDSGESIGKVTVSAGIALLKTDDSVDTFIDRADTALYQAKETGRNKVVIAE